MMASSVTSVGRQLGASHDGMLAEYRVRHVDWVIRTAYHLSFVEASTLPCAALTAWSGVHGERGPVGPGDTVLVLGTGGVALFVEVAALATRPKERNVTFVR
jgi:NADPH:quinone reductase-like Zn-dependent oxidoreductase